MVRPVWLLVFALAAITPRDARADKAQASAAFAEAKTKYGAGDYAAAAELFVRAYKLDPDPAYLFNVAQAYRLADDCPHAADYYQRFLDKVPNPPNVDAVRSWLGDAKKCVDDRTLRPPKPDRDQPPHHDEIVPPPEHPQPGGGRSNVASNVAPIMTIGAGVALLAIGGLFARDVYFLANQRDNLTESCNAIVGCTAATPRTAGGTVGDALADYDHRGHRAQILAVTGIAAGGVAIGAGIWLLVARRTTERSVAVASTRGGAVFATVFAF